VRDYRSELICAKWDQLVRHAVSEITCEDPRNTNGSTAKEVRAPRVRRKGRLLGYTAGNSASVGHRASITATSARNR
jgi:hypothetical protein